MTTAPARTELPKSYRPADHEDGIAALWERADIFHVEPGQVSRDGREPYSIVIPPPNVTAPLHLGHALNLTLQDILIRVHRMRGFATLWMPGTDHAGIATQTVVEKRLRAKGQKRREMGREAFVAKVHEWKDEYEATITTQLKAMGASCDWVRQRFTMDAMCTKAVRVAFFRLFADELIYRGKRLVNWDPVTLTALADDEVEMKEVEGFFWYLKYPIVDDAGQDTGEFVTVATTRPETMLGDTAVAVNPSDPERARFVGRTVRLPIVDRLIPVIADDYVVLPDPGSSDPKAQYATGYLKVTPAHDPNDWLIGLRHDLPVVNVMAPDATISDGHGWDDASDAALAYVGMTREAAREAIAEWFRTHDLLDGMKPYTHSVGHSYRSHVPVEPYLSDQWYVRVTDDRLVGEAQRALAPEQRTGDAPDRADGSGAREGDGALRFYPARYARMYESWHEGLRDWCISRQLWWGHQIPVWSAPAGAGDGVLRLDAWTREGRVAVQSDGDQPDDQPDDQAKRDDDEARTYVCVADPDDGEVVAALESAGYERDPDVLDTWFSSGLWPMSTMGWPDPDGSPETAGLLAAFNPTSVLSTGREIITLWVSRMVMLNRRFNEGRVPFRDVYIHPIVQDGHGQKMSKSLGNGVDPRDIIRTHGTDALRFTLGQIATATQDVRLPLDSRCPKCETTFTPRSVTNARGYLVAESRQPCPNCQQPLVSAYGVASGEAEPDAETPLALNTSAKFDLGRNFANKLWNASRFALGNLDGGPGDPELSRDGLSLVDRWIITRLHRTLHAVEDAVSEYQLSLYTDAMYDLVWRDFCDWYLEAIKPTVRDQPGQQQVLRTVLNAALRLLHPICPFVTEALWPAVTSAGAAGIDGIRLDPAALLAAAAWPDIQCRVHDESAETTFERVQALVNAVRALRAQHNVPPRKRVSLFATDQVRTLMQEADRVVETLGLLERVGAADETLPPDAIPFAFEGEELHLAGLVDAVDVEAERERLTRLVAEKEKAVQGYRGKLSNSGYVNNAPPAVVEETRARASDAEKDLAAARRALEALTGREA